MTSLNEKADAARGVVRASEAEGQWYRLQDRELAEAGDIGGEDQYPRYGEFADVTAVDKDGKRLGNRWLECPAHLARCLVDSGIAVGDCFQVTEASKADDGAWRFQIATDERAD